MDTNFVWCIPFLFIRSLLFWLVSVRCDVFVIIKYWINKYKNIYTYSVVFLYTQIALWFNLCESVFIFRWTFFADLTHGNCVLLHDFKQINCITVCIYVISMSFMFYQMQRRLDINLCYFVFGNRYCGVMSL